MLWVQAGDKTCRENYGRSLIESDGDRNEKKGALARMSVIRTQGEAEKQ